ncbi:MAG: DUF3417 domain-containing protein, partial [Alistipes sp.]|nr:DUF3417 domain-containing protein [Alistipes sp.]
MSNINQKPDYLFEVSWEVCNKVGGIHTVIATKALTATKSLGDKYITIGPDLMQESQNPEFEADDSLLAAWRESLYEEGIRVRIGRWKIEGNPIAILIDFKSLISQKDEVLKHLWEDYHVDSISGQWDYVEPVLFGHAAGIVVKSYVENFCKSVDNIVAHFHEWMTASGGLYLRKNSPYVATVFTTHATVAGRCIAGNGLSLYSDLHKYNADELARRFNVTAKHSIEKMAASFHDAFLTVSDITANECKYLLGREVTHITPNGFENDFVWQGEEYNEKRKAARKAMIEVAEACLQHKFEKEPLIIGTSGRYEFRNKGLDIFMDSLKRLATCALDREILAYITVPAANNGARADLVRHLADASQAIDETQWKFSTHYLEFPQWDPISQSIRGSVLESEDSKVKVIFVPSYLNSNDGVFNKNYYEMLVGMDLTAYPSYYEPWGYTPLESVAFSVPTITSNLSGFGLWAMKQADHEAVEVIRRDDNNDAYAVEQMVGATLRFLQLDEAQVEAVRAAASEISKKALWSNFFKHYERAYAEALENAASRLSHTTTEDGGNFAEQLNFVRQQLTSNKPSWHRMMVEKRLPSRLSALETISRNLWWSWTQDARDLFESIDPELWNAVERNPIALLDKLSLERINE